MHELLPPTSTPVRSPHRGAAPFRHAPPGSAPVSLAEVAQLLRGLNREQRRAVTHGEGPMLVVAGPGTGKTEVITRRVAWLIATKRALPSEILALTFTDKAAEEMQARVDILVPYGRADAAIHTFHAFGDRVLREYALELGLPGEPRLIGRAEVAVLLREHLFELGLRRYLPLGNPTRFVAALGTLFSRAKDEGIDPDAYRAFAADLAARASLEPAGPEDGTDAPAAARERAEGQLELAEAYARFQALLLERGLIDFGDQVRLAARLLAERADVRGELGRRFRFILVDEFQDTNPVQLELVRSLAGEGGNVTVVGDDDQAIYAFRGAALENLVAFGERFAGARRVVLRRNYRSRAPILTASRRLIRHNDPDRLEVRDGLDKVLVAHRRGRAAPVRGLAFATAEEEADGVAAAIAERIRGGTRAAEVCVLVRTNGEADVFLRSLRALGVPCRGGGAPTLGRRPEVRQLLGFLRSVANPESTVDLYALATADPYELGGTDLTTLLEMCRRRHRSLWSVCVELQDQPGILRLGARGRTAVARLVADLRAAAELAHTAPAGAVLYDHLRRTGRLARLAAGGEAEAPVLRNIARLFDLVRAQSLLLPDDRVPFVVPHLEVLLDVADDPAPTDPFQDSDAVSVLTVHRAKGLEFPIVYVTGLVDGRFPGRSSRELLPLPPELCARPITHADASSASLAEERRLCYVAMTRARDELILTYGAAGRGSRQRRPSPFLAEALDAVPALAAASAPVLERLTRHAAEPTPDAARDGTRAEPAGPLTLSYSQIDDYLTCPLKYRLRHVVGLPTPPHHALIFGNALHQAVAAFHARQARGTLMPEAELLDVFATHWQPEGFLSRAHEEARYAAGRDALRRFRRRELVRAGPPPTGIEKPFSFSMGRDRLRGRFDRLDGSGPDAVITDYKSSDVRDQKRADGRARDSLQLAIYALAHRAETGVPPATVQLHFLESGVVGRTTPDDAWLDRAAVRVERAAAGIRTGAFKPRPDAIACGMCPFRDICPSAAA